MDNSEHYEIEGYDVFFVRWHSEYMGEDFTAVSVAKDDREVCHAGMTKLEPSEEQAREVVETLAAIDKWLKDEKVVEHE